MKKYKLLTIVLLFILSAVFAQPLKYSKVKIFTEDLASFQKLISLGLDLEDQLNVKNLKTPELFVSSDEIRLIQEAGLRYEVLIEDWNQYYNSLPKMTPAEVQASKEKYNITGGFGYGSMGGNYTYTEMVSKLDSMRLLYPNLITAKQSIGTSVEGRQQWMVKISDNPDLEEIEPQVMFTALTHAREPQGMMTVLYYMYYLLENYNTNPEVKYLVNNREIYFIPCVNPDGYEYNRTTNPTGGGQWRKNRKNNSGSYGVDLNRNFGPYDYWNAPNGGSSTTPSSDTYRGTAPFSEPETNNYKNFVQTKTIKTALNYHTYSNLLVYPYGALNRETPDSAIFREFARDITSWNGYTYGTDLQTVGYSTRGNSDDFLYDGDPITTRPKVFAMTPEVGSTGFWPTSAEIFPLSIENLKPNLYYTWVAGGYPKIISKDFVKVGEYFLAGDTARMVCRIKNKGLAPTETINLVFTSLSPYIVLDSNFNYNLGYIDTRQEKTTTNSPLVFHILNNVPNGTTHKIQMITKLSGTDILIDTLSIIVGSPSIVVTDDFNSGLSGWATGSPAWGLFSTNPHSAPYNATDSPSGSYGNNVNTSLTKIQSFNLSNSGLAVLEFWGRWDIEAGWDFGQVQISSNGGTTWNSLKGIYTKPGSGKSGGKQPLGVPGYDGLQQTWVKENMNLSDYLGKSNLLLRFNFQSDGSTTKDGWHVDDVKILSYEISSSTSSSISTLEGWNIVSVPLAVDDGRKNILFPDALSNAYTFSNGYVMKDTLQLGIGYWLKFPLAGSYNVLGTLVNPMNVQINEGWNMIGVGNTNTPTSNITVNPPGILQSSFFEYNNGYQQVNTLSKGKGYWIKSSQGGTLTLNSSMLKNDVSENVSKEFECSLIFSDKSDSKAFLYLTKNQIEKVDEIPPIPPQNIFDVRFMDNTQIQNINDSKVISINSNNYPIKIKSSGINISNINIMDIITGEKINSRVGDAIVITNPAINKIKIEVKNDIPETFSLNQNYPNPFNPSTTIGYSIVNKENVELKIYDVLGRVVEKLIDQVQEPGRYSVEWNAQNYSSGIYYYELKAGNFTQLRKMLLMK